ncbi:MAG: histidine kinase [Uliginosibacterium sp.]|jgi:two-component sensor histidine kinase|nr:histidine kinase [Uliginosibacterium sp.]MBK9616069.1 histidine kinase [Uliginosibacterium sp.]
MHDLFASRRSTMLYFFAWLMLGGVLAGLIALVRDEAWLNALLFALPLAMLFAVGTAYSVYYLSRAFPLADKGLGQVLGVFSVASLLSGLAWAMVASIWNALWPLAELPGLAIMLDRVVIAMVLGLGTLLYGLCGVGHYLLVEHALSQAAAQRALESRVLAQEAELQMLRLQIDPHFLFNSLNSISALTSQDAGKARQMTLLLADFLRTSLRLGAAERIALADELGLVRQFLAIEKIRFGDRLMLEEWIDEASLQCLVPPLLLQPLVENAVKHGLSQLPQGGLLRLRTERSGAQLRIVVDNSVDADAPARARGGIGLANVSRRLAVACGSAASLVARREADRFSVEIEMPVETAGE